MDLCAVSFYLAREMASVAHTTDDEMPELVRSDVTHGGEMPDRPPPEWKQRFGNTSRRSSSKCSKTAPVSSAAAIR